MHADCIRFICGLFDTAYVCDEFFSLPLFPPASLCNNNDVDLKNAACHQGSCGGCGCGCGCNR